MVAAFSGASIPLLLERVGQDPASILLTTVTDVIGFLVFLGRATVAVEYPVTVSPPAGRP